MSDFRLDRYEITVGRFKRFMAAGSSPAPGSGKNPNNPSDPGWETGWTANINLAATVACYGAAWATLDDKQPMACMNWYEAYALCIWDGGRLPTEAEWNYAAAGGSEQRNYPWSTSMTDSTIDATYAVYAPQMRQTVGSKSPKGDARWGQADMAGNVSEVVQDFAGGGLLPNPCINCAILSPTRTQRGMRGGNFSLSASYLYAWYRFGVDPAPHYIDSGARCARAP